MPNCELYGILSLSLSRKQFLELLTVSEPKGLRRYCGSGHLHFVTCSGYHRQRWLDSARRRDLFLRILKESRQTYGFVVVGYVVAPEHIHLLMGKPQKEAALRTASAQKAGK